MRLSFLSTCFAVIFFNAYESHGQSPTISLTQVITGLSLPMQVLNAGDGSGRLFIIEKAGAIKVFDKDFNSLGVFLNTRDVNSGANERGLLSMVFHPDYKTNGFFYVFYTNNPGNLELDRYKVSSNPNVADAASRDTVIIIPHPTNNNHNGGELHFGNDGYLYLSTGDGGGSNDVPNNSQTTSVLLGKMLRLNVNTSDTKPFYTVPPDNPFGNEVFAYGLRNPFRWSFDRLTYDMWIGDVGQAAQEEIDFVRFDSTKGVNYGWRCYEGNVPRNLNGCGPIGNYTFPVFTFPTTAADNIAITGGVVYRGNTFLDLQGYYVACEYYTGNYFKIKRTAPGVFDTSTQKLSITGISDFGESEDGEMYATALGGGRLYRVQANGARRYTFTGSGNWNVSSNWSTNAIPPATLPSGSEIIIDPPADGECVLNISQTISAGARIVVKDDKKLLIPENLTIQ